MLELDDINAIGDKEEGFVLEAKIATTPLTELPREITIFVIDTSFTVEEVILYSMNGLYALKEKYPNVYLVVYGAIYLVSVRKHATPVKNDLMVVYNVVRDALGKILSPVAFDTLLGSVLVKINNGEFTYIE